MTNVFFVFASAACDGHYINGGYWFVTLVQLFHWLWNSTWTLHQWGLLVCDTGSIVSLVVELHFRICLNGLLIMTI